MGVTRITLNLSDKAHMRLIKIKKVMGVTTTAEAVRNSLRVADFITEEVTKGNTLCIRDENGVLTEIKLFV